MPPDTWPHMKHLHRSSSACAGAGPEPTTSPLSSIRSCEEFVGLSECTASRRLSRTPMPLTPPPLAGKLDKVGQLSVPAGARVSCDADGDTEAVSDSVPPLAVPVPVYTDTPFRAELVDKDDTAASSGVTVATHTPSPLPSDDDERSGMTVSSCSCSCSRAGVAAGGAPPLPRVSRNAAFPLVFRIGKLGHNPFAFSFAAAPESCAAPSSIGARVEGCPSRRCLVIPVPVERVIERRAGKGSLAVLPPEDPIEAESEPGAAVVGGVAVDEIEIASTRGGPPPLRWDSDNGGKAAAPLDGA